ncbi:MAG: hypothetical protein PHF00_12140 [Elusimicrobia bacterium]|nr:hypothetical protein [Elusimicrobiota bacterium]
MTRTQVLHDPDVDWHDDLLSQFGLDDRTPHPDFVRVEMLPNNGDVFDHARRNWRLKVDQDYRPDWFHEEEAGAAVWETVQATFRSRFLTTGHLREELNYGRWFLDGSAIIKRLGDVAVVKEARGAAILRTVGDTAVVERVCGRARLGTVHDGATVKEACGAAQINRVDGSATVKALAGRARIKELGGCATVERMLEHSTIERMTDSATVGCVRDAATLRRIGGSATAIIYSRQARWSVRDHAVVICRHESPMKIAVAQSGARLDVRGAPPGRRRDRSAR